ncbi:MAG: extracellular solute-binding protein [Lachnospiraceae bacterium]|nr:extracellular solute-binding protein [Lachnospiraceae bacterium]
MQKEVINVWAFTDEIPDMIQKYMELQPAFAEKYEINTTIISTSDGAYQPALDEALLDGGFDIPDIFSAESTFVLKYTQGEMSRFVLPYADLGIDVAKKIKEAKIVPYMVDVGSRQGEVVGLGFQSSGGAVIYRRSIAKAVWGTDDPEVIQRKIGPGWDVFLEAAREVNAAGYSMVSGPEDLWQVVRNTGDQPWIVDGKLVISSARADFMELHKKFYTENLSNNVSAWSEAWFADMQDEGSRPVFAFLGPAWLIDYIIIRNCGGQAVGEGTFGDWAVAMPPVGFFWGGTWLLVNASSNEAVRMGVAELIQWITLDSSETGAQHMLAASTLFDAKVSKDAVSSAVVMEKTDGSTDFLSGQNMFDVFVPAGAFADAKILTPYDETINEWFVAQSLEYAIGNKTKAEAMGDFKKQVNEYLGLSPT